MNNHFALSLQGREAVELLAQMKNPDAAMLYILSVAQGGACDLKETAAYLEWDDVRIQKAAVELRLWKIARNLPFENTEAGETPSTLADARTGNPIFSNMCNYLEIAMGRFLRKAELESLLWIYDNLALPPEVMVLLINQCKDEKRLSARSLTKAACQWHDMGLDSAEKAKAHLAAEKEKRSFAYKMRKIFGIYERRFTETEEKYIESWEKLGLSDELLSLAYDVTVRRTGKLTWGYMNKILQNWGEKGYKTAEDVRKSDKKPAPPKKEADIETAVARDFEKKRKAKEKIIAARMEELIAQSADFAALESRRRLASSRYARANDGQKEVLLQELQALLQEREALLLTLGREKGWLDNTPDCPKCLDLGFVGDKKCSCFVAACKAEEERRQTEK